MIDPKDKVPAKKRRELAYQLYELNKDMTQKEIADFVGVSEKTICDWKIKDKWEEKANSKKISTDKIKTRLQELLEKEVEAEKPNVDSLYKLNLILENIEANKVQARHALKVTDKLIDFLMANQEIALAKQLAEYAPLFVETLL